MKGIILGIVCIIVIGIIFTYNNTKAEEEIQKGIANHVIRLHVLANSDMENDQKLKIAVKNEIIKNLRSKLTRTNDIEGARKTLQNNLETIEEIAVSEMKKRGYSYSANAKLEQDYFPTKMYGDMTFPEGEYEALRVRLGEAEGKNWWCIMYPTLCFVDSTYQVVPDESKEILKKDLTAGEYQALLSGENITYDFKLLEWVENLFH